MYKNILRDLDNWTATADCFMLYGLYTDVWPRAILRNIGSTRNVSALGFASSISFLCSVRIFLNVTVVTIQ